MTVKSSTMVEEISECYNSKMAKIVQKLPTTVEEIFEYDNSPIIEIAH